jgi:hypothetical protein
MSKFTDLARTQPGSVISTTTYGAPVPLTIRTMNTTGVYAKTTSGSAALSGESVNGTGVRGFSTNGVGVDAASTTSTGLTAYSSCCPAINGWSADDVGVRGATSNANSWAGYFVGRVHATGGVTAPTLAAQIDDPRDPAHQYWTEAALQTDDLKSVYDGTVTTDATGRATVQLPAYVQAGHRDFRYQLTVIGQFAQAIVAQKIADNQFVIQTDKPHVEVSWQVTGRRTDPWATDHPLQVEAPKPAAEQGTYLYPQGYGQPASAAAHYTPTPPADR